MYCSKCGNKLPEGAKFCNKCGAEVKQVQAQTVSSGASGTAGQSPEGTQTAAGNSKGPDFGKISGWIKQNRVLIAAAAVVVVIAVVLIIVLTTRGTGVKLSRYIVFEETGYDGYGKASVSFDYEAFEEDYEGRIRLRTKNSEVEELEELYDALGISMDSEVLWLFEEYYITGRFYLDQSSGLSNGDTVTLMWDSYDGEMKEYFKKCRVDYSEMEFTVENLENIEKTDIFDMVDVVFSGTDTIGQAEIVITGDEGYIGDISFELSKDSALTNGESVTVKASVRGYSSLEDYCGENFGVIPVTDTKTFIVSGLRDVEIVDIFEYVTVEFTGISPMGTAVMTVDTSENMVRSLYFTLDSNSGLSNGDIVTVTAYPDYWGYDDLSEFMLEEFGILPECSSMEYTVEGLGEYVVSIEDIPEDALEGMRAQGLDVFMSYVANEWSDPDRLSSVRFVGNYFLVTKDWTTNRRDYNKCYCVYKAVYTTDDDEVEFFYYVMFNDIAVLGDGTSSVDLNSYETPSDRFYLTLSGTSYYFRGYETIDEVFTNCVNKNVEFYTFESAIDLSVPEENEDEGEPETQDAADEENEPDTLEDNGTSGQEDNAAGEADGE